MFKLFCCCDTSCTEESTEHQPETASRTSAVVVQPQAVQTGTSSTTTRLPNLQTPRQNDPITTQQNRTTCKSNSNKCLPSNAPQQSHNSSDIVTKNISATEQNVENVASPGFYQYFNDIFAKINSQAYIENNDFLDDFDEHHLQPNTEELREENVKYLPFWEEFEPKTTELSSESIPNHFLDNFDEQPLSAQQLLKQNNRELSFGDNFYPSTLKKRSESSSTSNKHLINFDEPSSLTEQLLQLNRRVWQGGSSNYNHLTTNVLQPSTSRRTCQTTTITNNLFTPKPYVSTHNLLPQNTREQENNSNHNLNNEQIKTKQPNQADVAKSTNHNLNFSWQIFELLQDKHNLTKKVAQELEKLFTEGKAISFIARHCKYIIGDMTTQKLTDVKNTYDKAVELRKDVLQSYIDIDKNLMVMTDSLSKALMNAKDQKTLKDIMMPHYEIINNKKLNPQRLELERSADLILQGQYRSPTDDLVDIVASKIGNSPESVAFLKDLCEKARCMLRTDRIIYCNTSDASSKDMENISKFKDYIDCTFLTSKLKPHQILGINRAEKLKVISVTLVFPDFLIMYYQQMQKVYSVASKGSTGDVFRKSVEFCYHTTVQTLLYKMKRDALNAVAEQEALKYVTDNYKQLLQTTPVKNTRILGLDPGKSLGCKLGLISETGEVLDTGVVFPNASAKNKQKRKLRDMLLKHNCSLIAIGNGTGSRNAETWISEMITNNYFKPLNVQYTIVNEIGASIYSCSKEAIREFGDMDPNLIGAISLARRVQNPVGELKKLHPRHMGIGMYQHDIAPDRLKEAVSAVIEQGAHDSRKTNTHKCVFRSDVKKMTDLNIGMELNGVVVNVVPFGCFVDIGVETEGLLHDSNRKGVKLAIGDCIVVEICSFDLDRGRISLKLLSVL